MSAAADRDRIDAIVLLDSLEALGGAETLAIDHVVGLDPDRFRRTLCLTRDQAQWRGLPAQRAILERLDAAGVDVLELGRRSRFSLRPWFRFVRELRRRRTAVLHGHKFGSNAWGVLCGKLASVPVIVAHEHMWSYDESSAVRRLADRRWVAPLSDRLIAVSAEGRRQMIAVEGVDSDDVIYIPNGVPDAPPPDRVAARRSLGLEADDIAIGTVALLRPEKRLELLVEAIAGLRESHPRVRAILVGDGPERPRIEALAKRLGVADAVTITGYRDDVQAVLPGFDMAVCCSRFEGGPLSVMEYMEARLPIVATAVGGLPEMLDEGRCGVLVSPDDATALSDGIDRVLADPELCASIGEAAFERKRAVYSLDAWVRRLEDLYDEVLAGKAAA